MKKVELSEKVERVFSHRQRLAQVRLADEVIQLDDDVEDALWFSGREWHELTWQNWQEHSDAIFFFDPEAFAYYLPSILLLSAQNSNEALNAADSLIGELDRTPAPGEWAESFISRFSELNRAELDLLKEWLLQICEYEPYKRWGIAASGPGDTFGRAFDTVDLLQKEVERRRLASG
jgi:hypothetical protein